MAAARSIKAKLEGETLNITFDGAKTCPKKKRIRKPGAARWPEFLLSWKRTYGKNSTFFSHLHQSQVELLKAIRSLVDDRIGELEKRKERGRKKATKIEVE